MTHDEALAIYNTGSKVVVKTLCDLSSTIELQKALITEFEIKNRQALKKLIQFQQTPFLR